MSLNRVRPPSCIQWVHSGSSLLGRLLISEIQLPLHADRIKYPGGWNIWEIKYTVTLEVDPSLVLLENCHYKSFSDRLMYCPALSPSIIPDSKVCCFAVYVCPDSRPLTGLTSLKMSVYCAVHGHVCVVCRECHFLVVSIITMLWFTCTPGVPLTPSNVMGAVEEARRWWGVGGLADRLHIPLSKQDEIKRNFPDELEQKKQMISYWINADPLAGWRRLITALDRMGETQLADLIRSNAEPLTGSPVHNVHKCAW